PRPPDVTGRVVQPQLLRIFGGQAGWDVAQRVVRRRLVGHDVDGKTAGGERRQHLGGVAVQPDRDGAPGRLRLGRELQRVLDVVGPNVEVAVVDAAPDTRVVRLHADGDAAVERYRERLS